jgi:hypothetical protein
VATIQAADVAVGDAVELPAGMLHEDLSGLVAQIKVADKRTLGNGKIDLYDAYSQQWVWFEPNEPVKVTNRAV